MGRLFQSPQQRAIREAIDKQSELIKSLLSESSVYSPDTKGKLEVLDRIFELEKNYVLNKTAEYLASQGIPQGSIRAVNLANALVPISMERLRQELGILNLADQFNLQKLGTKSAITNSLANLYLTKAQLGYSPYSPFDIGLMFLNTLANIGQAAFQAFSRVPRKL